MQMHAGLPPTFRNQRPDYRAGASSERGVCPPALGRPERGNGRISNPSRRAAHRAASGGKPLGCNASRNGETRTPTGDTTIFRQSLQTLEPGEKPCKQAACRNRPRRVDTRRFHSFHGDSGDGRGFIAFSRAPPPERGSCRVDACDLPHLTRAVSSARRRLPGRENGVSRHQRVAAPAGCRRARSKPRRGVVPSRRAGAHRCCRRATGDRRCQPA
jgi:hypothetical protein